MAAQYGWRFGRLIARVADSSFVNEPTRRTLFHCFGRAETFDEHSRVDRFD
jgi:hypothetical protein